MKTNSMEYEAAVNMANAASKAYGVAVAAYRARTIGDAEYLKAHKIYMAAEAEFDVAFAKEVTLSEES
jgi:hypothetical protein